jgi:hypothetical protein
MHRSGGEWNQLGSIFNGTVHALAMHNGMLTAAGAFTALESDTDPVIMHVAQLEGYEWVQLGDGLDATVRTLYSPFPNNSTLYAGGDLYANIVPTFGLAAISAGNAAWEHLLPNHADYMPSELGPTYISSLVMDMNAAVIYFGGRFSISPLLGTYGTNIASLSGITADMVEGMAVLDEPVNSVALMGDHLVMGGEFHASYPHIAAVDLATGILDHGAELLALEIAPNPSFDQVTVNVPDAFGTNALVRMMDAAGKVMDVPVQRSGNMLRVDVQRLAQGSYLLELTGNDRSAMGRVVKK